MVTGSDILTSGRAEQENGRPRLNFDEPKFQQIQGGQRMKAFNLRSSLNLLDMSSYP